MKIVTAEGSASLTARAPLVSSSSTTFFPAAWIRATSERRVP